MHKAVEKKFSSQFAGQARKSASNFSETGLNLF
jgi:hypothetical protein